MSQTQPRELRYAAPVASITAFRTQPTASKHPQTQAALSQPDTSTVTLNIKHARQWTHNLSSVLVQLANKPVTLPCIKQLDM